MISFGELMNIILFGLALFGIALAISIPFATFAWWLKQRKIRKYIQKNIPIKLKEEVQNARQTKEADRESARIFYSGADREITEREFKPEREVETIRRAEPEVERVNRDSGTSIAGPEPSEIQRMDDERNSQVERRRKPSRYTPI